MDKLLLETGDALLQEDGYNILLDYYLSYWLSVMLYTSSYHSVMPYTCPYHTVTLSTRDY